MYTKNSFLTMRSRSTFDNFEEKFKTDNYVSPVIKAQKREEEINMPMPVIILMSPFLDQNVGSVSRGMLNFGMSELRIVEPRCDHLSKDARTLAVGSFEVLEQAKIYPTLEEAVGDLSCVLATTAREREMTQQIYTATEGAALLYDITKEELTNSAGSNNISSNTGSDVDSNSNSNSNTGKVGLLFGRETHGLTNKELCQANGVICIDAFPGYSVLNLAQAVNIVSYEVWKHFDLNNPNHHKKSNTFDDQDKPENDFGISVSDSNSTGSSTGSSTGDSTGSSTGSSNYGRLSSGTNGNKGGRNSLAILDEVNNLLHRLEQALLERRYRTHSYENSNNNVGKSDDNHSSNSSGNGDGERDGSIKYEKDFREIRSTVRRLRMTKKEVRTWHGILTTLLKPKT